jgi:two-component system NtrC family response regulator
MNSPNRKLMIVEDDKGLQRQLRWAFEACDVVLAHDQKSAMEVLAAETPPVVILDLGLPPDPDGPTAGLATLESILAAAPTTKVVMMTGQSERAHAVKAIASGAYDFYQKPVEIEALDLIIKRAFQLYELEEEHRRGTQTSADRLVRGLITTNEAMRQVLDKIRMFARSDGSTLILGESGTGKELIARGMHELSDRSEEPFVAINCASIPENLLESELFGHEKGAFTGAVKTTAGKVELANRGTLFLDEIGDLGMALQAKLLRFLQERTIERIGGRKQIAVDVRVVSATNKDLEQLIASGEFREDLYYRLSEFQIQVPSLRERPEDTIVIANHYLQEFSEAERVAARSFSTDALAAMAGHSWPGNVRELQNRLREAVITATGSRVTSQDLGLSIPEPEGPVETLREARDRAERNAILAALRANDGNITKAAKGLGVSRPTLYDLLRQHNLKA